MKPKIPDINSNNACAARTLQAASHPFAECRYCNGGKKYVEQFFLLLVSVPLLLIEICMMSIDIMLIKIITV